MSEELNRKHVRTLQQVWKDYLWPSGGIDPDSLESVRHQAIAEVLCSIPEDDYERLKAAAESDSFVWFMPHAQTHGMVYPVNATHYPEPEESGLQHVPYARVLYLSPRLERAARDIVVATVAHELAHIVLGHELWHYPDVEEAGEEAAFELLCKWGFERQAKKHRAVGKWRKSYEQYQINKLAKEFGGIQL